MKRLLWATFALVFAVPSHAQESARDSKERLTEYVYTLTSDSLEGRKFGTPSGFAAAEYVAARFAEAGLETYGEGGYLHPFEAGMQGYNVIGVLRGNDPELKDEWLILGAHFDHLGRRGTAIYHGADDNASGTAVLIETARNLAARRGELRRSVMFVAFDGEEAGLLGSRYLTGNLPEGEVKLVASLDMVGWLRASKRLRIAGVATLDDGKKIFGNVDGGGEWLKLKKFDTFIMGGSDHDPFGSMGIPALHISTGMRSPYHKPEDTPDKIDYEGLALISGYMTSATAEIASRDKLDASGKISYKHKTEPMLTAGITASIGNNRHIYRKGALDGKSAFAWNAGVWAQVNFGNWAIRPGVVYEQRRAKMPVDFGQRTSTILQTGGIYTPLDVMYKLPFAARGNMYLYLFVGGYYSRVLTGTLGGDKVDFSAAGALRRNEWGLQFGGGVAIYKFRMEGVSRYGLTDIYPAGVGHDGIRNASAYFSVGYRF